MNTVKSLAEKHDCCILIADPWKNPSAWAGKNAYVTKYLDCILHKKLLDNGSAILIDDRKAYSADSFKERLIPFGADIFLDGKFVLLKLKGQLIFQTPSLVS